jgi:sigma-B regulation protein RsbU (phosphoserine phosphatase)
MAGVDPATLVDAVRIQRILAPLVASAPGLTITIEDASGMIVAASADRTGSDAPSLTRELRVNGVLAGRVVAEGSAIGEPALRAAIEALAISLEELADAERRALRAPDGEAARTSVIAGELALSRLQQRTIVSLIAPDVAGYDLASHYEAAREIGGDFFELFRLRRRGHPLGIVIADVAGKGIAAALLMAFARPVLHTALTAASGPADALERTNRVLVEDIHAALFITALAARLDVKTGSLRIANAGHEHPLLVPGDGSPVRQIDGAGPLLGAFGSLGVDEVELTLERGDQLVLYTDGVTDTRTADGERFGKARLLATVERARGRTVHDLVAAIRDDAAAFCSSREPADDVTIVALGRL